MTGEAIRSAFCARLGFDLDDFQRDACDALDAGASVLVAAPTGSGKTIVAEYAIARARAAGVKVFYTTPLKALSNQKFRDLREEHGTGNVGLLTGDNSIDGDAPIVVMTTEVLRNMIYAGSDALADLRYVVLDEVHYLQNPYRGAVWEEVIIHLPLDVKLVCLSATVSNAEEVAEWLRTVRGETAAVIEERRPVELRHLYAVGDRVEGRVEIIPTFVEGDGGTARPNPEGARLDRDNAGSRRGHPRAARRTRVVSPRRTEVVERLDDDGLLPAIYFIFSRAACNDAVRQCLRDGIRLTDAAERRELTRIAEQHLATLTDDDLDVLGYDDWLSGFTAGIASHHAGLVPPMKEAVEEAFGAGLVKVVFATETLSLGINMPARSVVIEKLSKFTGEHHEPLTPGEYTQLAGRAGRRGIDALGYSVVCWNPFVPFEQVAALASRRTYALTSSFRPTYNMAVNLVQRCSPERARHLLNLSFAQYRADRDVVALEAQLDRTRELLARQRTTLHDDDGALRDYRRLVAERDAQRTASRAAQQSQAEHLRPGDVIRLPWNGFAVVLKLEHGRTTGGVVAVNSHAKIVRLHLDELRTGRVATVELPRPFQLRNPRFLGDVAGSLRALRLDRSGDELVDDGADALAAAEHAVESHPLHGTPDLTVRLRAAGAVDRLERDLARLERRAATRNDSLARTFERVLGLLESWGYTSGWDLTDAGRALARVYTEGDLVLAEALREGLLDGLDPPSLAAVVSCVTYERRGGDMDAGTPPREWPSKQVAQRCRGVDRIWHDLQLAEQDHRLPVTRRPDPGFTPTIARWVAGEELADLLADEELTGGDFVRVVKQIIDLLRQIAQVAPDPVTAATARAAADRCLRGVVAASSTVGT